MLIEGKDLPTSAEGVTVPPLVPPGRGVIKLLNRNLPGVCKFTDLVYECFFQFRQPVFKFQ